MPHLFVAVWGVPFKKTDVQTKLSELETAARVAYSSMKDAKSTMNVASTLHVIQPTFVFVAPEYYFTHAIDLIPGEFILYDWNERDYVYSSLGNLSKTYPGLILIPGTVNYQINTNSKFIQFFPKYLSKANSANKSAVGVSFAPVFLDGKLLLNYNKKFNDENIDKYAKDTIYLEGDKAAKQTFVTPQGLNFGIDVCGDIVDGELSKTLVGKPKIDVEALISGSVAHYLDDAMIDTVPVRDGGAFIHCDNTGQADRNGVWALNRGKGWHGSRGHLDYEYVFKDLDGYTRSIVFAPAGEAKGLHYHPGQTIKVVVHGSGNPETLDATVNKTSPAGIFIENLSLVIKNPGKGSQSVEFNDNQHGFVYDVILTREQSGRSVRVSQVRGVGPDRSAMKVSGGGNVSKIGKLLPGPQGDDPYLITYYLPI